MRSFLCLSLLIYSLVLFVTADNVKVHHKSSFSRRYSHPQVARESYETFNNRSLNNEVTVATRDLEKRFEGARFTFFDAGLGACGRTNSNSDFIVALNAAQYGSGGHCLESITIIINGKTATAQITDRCGICPYGGLDFSRGLFTYFAPESVGTLSGAWYFGSGPVTTTTAAARPTTSTTQTPTSTSTSTSRPTAASSSTMLSSSVAPSSTASAADALKSSSPNVTMVDGNLEQINLVFVELGAIIFAAVHDAN